jgi:hypothetical protein
MVKKRIGHEHSFLIPTPFQSVQKQVGEVVAAIDADADADAD